MTSPAPALLDCRWLSAPGGAGRVVQHLVSGLAELPSPARPVTVWGSPRHLGELPEWCEVAPTDLVGSEWRGQRQLFDLPPHDGAVYLHQVRPLRDWTSATLIHDTIQLRQGPAVARRLKRRFLRTVARRSQRILTVSEHSRRSIVSDLGCDPEKIRVLAVPMDPTFAAQVRDRRAGLTSDFGSDVLWVGQPGPHKNLDGLLEAFAASGLDGRVRLRLFGPHGPQRAALLERARELDIDSFDVDVSTTDDDLVDAYARAALVVMPSFEEGFGLPAFEAIACGIPVVASTGGSLPELARHAAGSFQTPDVRVPGQLARALAEAPLDVDRTTMDRDSHAAGATGATCGSFASDIVDTLVGLGRHRPAP